MNFNYTFIALDNNNYELTLSGYLEESSELPKSLPLDNAQALYIDFEELKFINSGGIKTWVNFANYLEAFDDTTIVYKNCHRVMIDQINLISGLLPNNASVLSLYIPIYCTKCEKSYEVFQLTHQIEDNFKDILNRAKPAKCNSSNVCEDLEVDIFPELYFKFLNK